MNSLKVGEVAAAAGVTVATIRYYERRGILPRAVRSAGNYRLYDERAVRTIRFVKQAQAIGFSLEDVTGLLALRELSGARASEVRAIATDKLVALDRQLHQLQEARRMLRALLASCPGTHDQKRCPIIEALDEDALDPHSG